jgi:hypothetical protein
MAVSSNRIMVASLAAGRTSGFSFSTVNSDAVDDRLIGRDHAAILAAHVCDRQIANLIRGRKRPRQSRQAISEAGVFDQVYIETEIRAHLTVASAELFVITPVTTGLRQLANRNRYSSSASKNAL